MIPISLASSCAAVSSVTSNTLTWTKGPRSRSYELKLNGQVVGRMEQPSFWSSDYTVETADGRWTFRQAGFFGGVEIVEEASQRTIATLKSSWGMSGGTLTFADGQKFELQASGWWRPVWAVSFEKGLPVLQLHVREGTLEMPSGADAVKGRLSLLAMFTYYRVLKTNEDAAAVLAAV